MTRLSEAGADAILSGADARTFDRPLIERLLAKRLLEEQAPLADWDVCDGCDCGLPGRAIRADGDGFRADCPLDPRQDVILSADDLRTFRIGQAALAREIAIAAGLTREPAEIAKGAWHLGATASGRALFLILARSIALSDGLVATLRQAARGAPVTLLGPDLAAAGVLRLEDAGIHHVVTADAVESDTIGWALDPAGFEPRLIVREAAGEVVLDGRALKLPHQPLRLLIALFEKAQSGDPVLSGREIESLTGREPRDVIRELRHRLMRAGFDRDDAAELILTRHGRGWEIVLQPGDRLERC